MPHPNAELEALLACPRCGAGLETLHCKACPADFPLHGGIPWLFADPGAAVSDWQNRWQLALERLREDAHRVRSALKSKPQEPTRRRLEALEAGYRAQPDHLDAILEPLRLAGGGSLETLLALRTRLPPTQGIFSYDANVFRDWAWGAQECALALDAVQAALAERSPARVLVLGAGAGRLAYDLHKQSAAALTVALDFNPLLAYVGHRAAAGETVSLVEFPVAPRTPEAAAIERALGAPEPARPGLEFVLADALRPPFRPGSFDLVVTPWLLDVCDESAATTLARINGLLADDGLWIHHGSVAFDGPDPAERLTLAELEATAGTAGFADLAADEACMPYMDCPDSRHGRRESVVTLRGRKARNIKAPEKHRALPDWIVAGRAPVPALPAFQTQAMTTRMHAFIMSLIDGKRSLKDMARVMEEQRLMPRQEAESALRGFLVKMYDEAQAGGAPRL
ncbi:MAG: methyltransferase domain-containing protein [Gammaproteobacteria bacterium]|jgi:SAM-dependent methyltransferase/uncharacterized protein YbaR (Trm112 family)|nr:methyltransferase domain-containing protein [Gammaproteobacteria bacterium]